MPQLITAVWQNGGFSAKFYSSSSIELLYKTEHLCFDFRHFAKLQNDLIRASDSFVAELSLVATIEDNIVGHILLSKIQIIGEQNQITESLALAPMAVCPDFQNQGIGGKLIKTVLDKAKELKYKSVIVLGHEKYYPKFGFEPAQKWQIKCPYDVPANVFMAIELTVDGLKNTSGMVKYPKAFESV